MNTNVDWGQENEFSGLPGISGKMDLSLVEQSLSSVFDIFFSSLIIFDVFHFTSKDHKIFQNIGKKLKKNFVHLTIIPFLYGTFKNP